MSMFEPVPVSVQAFVTTIHVSLVALRNHRSAGLHLISSSALVSLFFSSFPWLFASPLGLGIGLVVQLAWLLICEAFTEMRPAPVAAGAAPIRSLVSARRSVRSGSSTFRSGARNEFVQVPVLATFDETPDIKTFRLSRPPGFDFEPGQFLVVRARTNGQEHARCYSISSAPEARSYIEISVKRQGAVSRAFHAALRPGALLSVKGPAGAFTYPAGDPRPIVLLAGGVGITPLMSMLRHGTCVEPRRPITLLYSAQHEGGHAFRDELQTLAQRHSRLRLRCCVTRGTNGPEFHSGRIDEALIRTAVPDIGRSISFICGPGSMIDGLRALLVDSLGVPPDHVKSEYFETAVAASTTVRSQRESGLVARDARTSRRTEQDVEVRFEKSGVHAPTLCGQTLLETAEANGVAIPYLCRAGVCGTCRTRVISGHLACDSDLLDADERESGVVLACVTLVDANCVVEA